MSLPWKEKTAEDRISPRECIGCARDALNRAYTYPEALAVNVIIEAVDWLRRGLEQMAEAVPVTPAEPGLSAEPGVRQAGCPGPPRSGDGR